MFMDLLGSKLVFMTLFNDDFMKHISHVDYSFLLLKSKLRNANYSAKSNLLFSNGHIGTDQFTDF